MVDASYQTNAKQVASNELDRLFKERVGEFWAYCIVFFFSLGFVGWLVVGTWRIFVPLAAISLSGGITGTLFARSQRSAAKKELEALLNLSEQDRRSSDTILDEIEGLKAYPPSLVALKRSIFG